MYRCLFIILIVVCGGFCAINDTDKMVMAAAESQLPVFLSKIPEGQQVSYGFKGDDDLDLCTIGKPCRMLFFNNDFYNSPVDENKNYILIKNEWRVPVIVDSGYRTLLTMAGNPGNYIITAMGDTMLAKELQQQSTENENDEYYILRIPRLRADFFVTERNNSFSDAHFTPLLTAVIALPALSNNSKPSFTLIEVERAVKEALGKGKK